MKKKIQKKEARIGVIGLGYVGLPVAALFADAGFDVLGVDIDQERVETIKRGVSPIKGKEPGLAELLEKVIENGQFRAVTDYDHLKDRDVILIDVETPINEAHQPEYLALKSVIRDLGPVLKDGTLVIVESTLAPRTMQDLVQPLLEESSGAKMSDGFFLGNCPERVMPGKLLKNLKTMNRVVGGMTPETADVMTALYSQIVEGDLDRTDCLTAEIVKTAENAYRDVNIAFANEMALICEDLGGDVWKVREMVNKVPGRNMLLPGTGVGGHCIPKDPWLLVSNLRDENRSRLIPMARAVNDGMPGHMVDLLKEALDEVGITLSEAKVLVMGYAYLENSDDIRNSPSKELVKCLEKLGTKVVIHDPYVEAYQKDIYEAAEGCDAIVIMVKHEKYQGSNLKELSKKNKQPLVIDGRKMDSIDNSPYRVMRYFLLGKGK
ncbi:MAG: nucleotide sugar dehydrogenase [Bacteroidales bacterium]|nr:nucleotide sugar dehydrogenase [Bacteroidales bacterium]